MIGMVVLALSHALSKTFSASSSSLAKLEEAQEPARRMVDDTTSQTLLNVPLVQPEHTPLAARLLYPLGHVEHNSEASALNLPLKQSEHEGDLALL